MRDDHDHAPDGGLEIDLPRFVGRRDAFRLIAGFGLVTFAACRGGDDPASTTSSPLAQATRSPSGTSTADRDCERIPAETGGPFPGDGSNGPNILTESGVVRRDIRTSTGGASGTADGVPLEIALTVLSLADGCSPFEGAAVYVWQCDRAGNYSMYSPDAQSENYLRGVQAADADGKLSFTSIFPAAYPGRWPHVHFEVYRDLDAASSVGGKLATSQLALPKDVCDTAYATSGYEQSLENMRTLSLETDGVFRDGYSAQLARTSGDADNGYRAELTIAV